MTSAGASPRSAAVAANASAIVPAASSARSASGSASAPRCRPARRRASRHPRAVSIDPVHAARFSARSASSASSAAGRRPRDPLHARGGRGVERRELRGELERRGRGVVGQAVDEPDRVRLGGLDRRIVRQRSIARPRPDERRQGPRADREPVAGPGELDPRAGRRHPQVGRDRELRAAADGRPVERGDDDRVARRHAAVQLVEQVARPRRARRRRAAGRPRRRTRRSRSSRGRRPARPARANASRSSSSSGRSSALRRSGGSSRRRRTPGAGRSRPSGGWPVVSSTAPVSLPAPFAQKTATAEGRCPTSAPTTASGCTSRRPATARPCCSCTSSPATIAAGSRRSAPSRRRYRCIVYAARGYPPSDVPQDRGRVLAGARRRGHRRRARRASASTARTSSGCRWAASPTLHLGLRHPGRARSLVVAGVRLRRAARAAGGRSARSRGRSPTPFATEGAAEVRRSATRSARRGCSSRTRTRAAGPSSPRSSPSTRLVGSALTMRGVQARAAVALRPRPRAARARACRR